MRGISSIAKAETPASASDFSARHERRIASGEVPLARAYIDGGAENGLTLAANTAAWQQRELLPRLLRGIPG